MWYQLSKCVSISISFFCPWLKSMKPQHTHTNTHSPLSTVHSPQRNSNTPTLRYTNPIPTNPPPSIHHQYPNHSWTDTLKTLIKQHYDRICKLEDQKYDLEYVVKRKDVEVHEHSTLISTIMPISKSILDQNQKLTLNNYNYSYTFC